MGCLIKLRRMSGFQVMVFINVYNFPLKIFLLVTDSIFIDTVLMLFRGVAENPQDHTEDPNPLDLILVTD